MSLQITPYPTASAMQAALNGQPGGIALQAKYIGVGTGLHEIMLDDGGRAVTDQLTQPVAWLEILSAERVSPYQWQLVVDVAGTNNAAEYNLSEIALSAAETEAEANNQVIAIYSHPSQAIMTVTPQADHVLLAINLVLATMPADSVEIVHHNLPLDLSIASELAAVMLSVGEMAAATREMAQQQWELQAENQDQYEQLETQRDQLAVQAGQLATLENWRSSVDQRLAEQDEFNATTHNAVGVLSGVI